MKIRITKCSENKWWYNKYIGFIFYVEKVHSTNYQVEKGFILKSDCEVIPDEPVLIEQNENLFQAAVAAMQGLVSAENCTTDMKLVVSDAWDLAGHLINEGKKRGHL